MLGQGLARGRPASALYSLGVLAASSPGGGLAAHGVDGARTPPGGTAGPRAIRPGGRSGSTFSGAQEMSGVGEHVGPVQSPRAEAGATVILLSQKETSARGRELAPRWAALGPHGAHQGPGGSG